MAALARNAIQWNFVFILGFPFLFYGQIYLFEFYQKRRAMTSISPVNHSERCSM